MLPLLRLALGIGGESGELIEVIKKHFIQGRPLDRDAVRKEMGDVLWYLAVACEDMEWDLGCLAEENIAKLKKRYPEGFTAERSINRDE